MPRSASIVVLSIKVFARFQSRLFRIVRDVTAQILVLLYAAHQVVEWFLLPKLSTSFQCFVDLHRRVMEPRIALSRHRIVRAERCEQVNMIWHYNKIAKAVSLT